jgi:tRNA U38,U39,U40 pseudouridine synthase TruA
VVRIDLEANAFLAHQVRRMTGVLVEVGQERLGVAEYAALLDGPPGSAGSVAPACGLHLMRVDYAKPLFKSLDSERVVW